MLIQEDSDEGECSTPKIKKSNCNFGLLQAWYEDRYLISSNSPKKSERKSLGKVLVVIIPSFERFNEKVLQDFILILRYVLVVLKERIEVKAVFKVYWKAC